MISLSLYCITIAQSLIPFPCFPLSVPWIHCTFQMALEEELVSRCQSKYPSSCCFSVVPRPECGPTLDCVIYISFHSHYLFPLRLGPCASLPTPPAVSGDRSGILPCMVAARPSPILLSFCHQKTSHPTSIAPSSLIPILQLTSSHRFSSPFTLDSTPGHLTRVSNAGEHILGYSLVVIDANVA